MQLLAMVSFSLTYLSIDLNGRPDCCEEDQNRHPNNGGIRP